MVVRYYNCQPYRSRPACIFCKAAILLCRLSEAPCKIHGVKPITVSPSTANRSPREIYGVKLVTLSLAGRQQDQRNLRRKSLVRVSLCARFTAMRKSSLAPIGLAYGYQSGCLFH